MFPSYALSSYNKAFIHQMSNPIRKKRSQFSINARACCKTIIAETFSYSTVREASIENKPVAIVYRLVQLSILAYIIGYDIVWNKGYQAFDVASSTVTTKVKGLGFISEELNLNSTSVTGHITARDLINQMNNGGKFRIFDTADYVVPPNEYNSIFIMTNFIETMQKPGLCEELKSSARCTKDEDCMNRQSMINSWNGLPSGKCIDSPSSKTKKACEIIGWCPVERDPDDEAVNLIKNTRNYTIFIKNDVEFRKFAKKERNIGKEITNSYISSCKFNKYNDTKCPVFLLDYILREAEPDPEEQHKMLLRGGLIQVGIEYNCDYDRIFTACQPKYSFKRFDLPFKETLSASGFNFRFANKYMINGTEYRTLFKAYGLRIIITVTGNAGKFSILPLMITVGAGFGLMGFSVLIADCILLNFTEKKKLFQKLKAVDAKEELEKSTTQLKPTGGNDNDTGDDDEEELKDLDIKSQTLKNVNVNCYRV